MLLLPVAVRVAVDEISAGGVDDSVVLERVLLLLGVFVAVIEPCLVVEELTVLGDLVEECVLVTVVDLVDLLVLSVDLLSVDEE